MRCSAILRCMRARSASSLLGPSRTFSSSCLARANFCWLNRDRASSYILSCAWTRGSTSSTPPRWAGGGGGKVFFFCDLDELRAAPLECLDDPEEGLRAFAMGRMLTEPVSRVNGCARGHFGGQESAGVTERRHRPKIGRGVRSGIADTVCAVHAK